MQNKNIIDKIKEAENFTEKRIEKARNDAIERLNLVKHEKEKYLAEIEKNLEPKIKKLKEETEKNIQGAKMMHKKELERKLEIIEKISAEKIDEAVDFIVKQINTNQTSNEH
ncbi:MAG: hypothetical protein V1770_04470 [bacterium]